MLNFLAIIAANILSLPGILGLGLGMMTRNLVVAAVLGALVGVFQTWAFSGRDLGSVEPIELGVAVTVGVIFAILGRGIRVIGTTV